MVAEGETIRGAFLQRLEQHTAVEPGAARYSHGLRQCYHRLNENHIVEDLDDLAGPDRPAMSDVRRECPKQRLKFGKVVRLRPNHDTERAIFRGLPRSCDR